MKDFNESVEARKDKHLIARLLNYLKPYSGKFVVSFLLMILTTLAGMILPLISGLAIDYMADTSLELSERLKLLNIGIIGIFILIVVTITISYFQQMILQDIGQDVTHLMRTQVFEHIEQLSIGQINQLPVGKLVTRANNDPANISDMFTNTIVNLVKNIMSMLIILVIMFLINWQMALIALVSVPLIVIATLFFRKYSRKAYRKTRDNVSNVNAFLSENLSGMKITQVFNQEEKKRKEFKKINDDLRKSYLKEIIIFGVYRPVIWASAMIASILSVYFGVQAVFAGTLTIGFFFSFYIYVGQLYEPVQQIADQFNNLQSGFASAEKIFDVLDTKPDIVDSPDAIELTEFKGEIEFKDVWFSYVPDEWVLKGVSFKVLPNETVAFVGSTGSGKTTILQLIVRNYDIQKGEILIDGIDIKKIKRSSLRSFVGQMLQDVFLFSGTIKENITLGDESITDSDIKAASEYVGLDYVLNKLPDGLDHVVRERGNNFSSGERQLISFARAVVYQPSLMILDEATANIDSETEAIIQDSLNKMMNISTMLIVAHRLSTIQHSDKILVMSKGEVKEMGSHQELLKQKGIYYNLYKLQYDKQEGEINA
ncbi:ABC transporter ATP-binding protein [Acholeplasma hippikon]|uniref:ABC-type multidrug/protein/lipid transport system ATPase component n=1 Tax=Acholeplasma hippikon TaxID=264636 RepID=A0A449BHS0_9MOLU|nr:ABC transporter ATP-binding protein [Acholeplasma hippikon]VEU82004.1 ABC-type multidrug/protein/lipid transport system ATPase component [Acholeplasma hippikon]